MLISTLQSKKTYLLSTIEREQKGRKIDIVEEAKSRTISFESSQNCDINLKDEEPKDVKIFDVIKIINEVLVKGMVLLKKNISTIEDIIENDQFNEEYSESFLSNINTFTSNMALAYIYKKNKNYSEAFNKLEGYINDLGRTVENKEARTLLQKILISFGKNYEYADVFEQGLKILLKNHFLPAFEILLSNELISIENFLGLLDDIDKNNNQGMQSKKELFLKLLCEDKKYSNYSNEKHQTLYMELLLNKLFSEVKKEYVPPPKDKDAKEYEGLPNKYKNFKELFTKFTKYNKDHLLNVTLY
jgi:heterodisulfide reductase subunit C